MSYSTRSCKFTATAQPNYRILAGIQTEGQKPRRTPTEAANDREQAGVRRLEIQAKQRALAQRIAELEREMKNEDEHYATEVARTPASLKAITSEHRAVVAGGSSIPLQTDDGNAGREEDDAPLVAKAKPGKVKKLTRTDVDAAHKVLEANATSGPASVLARGEENMPPVAASGGLVRPSKRKEVPAMSSESHASKKLKPAHPTGVRNTWTPKPVKPPHKSKSKFAKAASAPSGTGIVINAGGGGLQDSGDENGDVERAALHGSGARAQGRHTSNGIVHIDLTQSQETQLADDPVEAVARRGNSSKRFTNSDLPIPLGLLWKWRLQLIPRYLEKIGESACNPWNVVGLDLVAMLQQLWDEIFPDIPIIVTPREAVYDVAQQRVRDWRHKIAEAGVAAVANFFVLQAKNGGVETEEEIAEYVKWALGSGMPFRYAGATMKGPDGKVPLPDSKGPFQSEFVLRTLGAHFACTNRCSEIAGIPDAALALCITSVERALKRWESGSIADVPEPKFSQETYGRITNYYLNSVCNLREATWAKIIEGGERWRCTFRLLPGDFSDSEWEAGADGERGAIEDDSD
ncbi:hypothetical protein SCP_1201690 [Sparassis crispa]|uniref:DUF6532 domain-containing protein n=1 Tax=Sparassis crispa TaxID=139825 RepID=A0A401H0K7_9APHY|nr:hypothetical protein SCP_1201690 [Sparassis crispa]GBE87943.1 hypothetical protein SCP_1201690 [Sparassis crispa]